MANDNTLNVEIKAVITNLERNLRKATKGLEKFSEKSKVIGRKMQKTGTTLTKSLTVPLSILGGVAVKAAIDFDKAMTQITSLVGIASNEVSKMGDVAKQMAFDTGKSATEAAEALFFITSAGLRGSEAMEVLEASLKASAIGLGNTKIIADLSTSALNAYGSENLSASEATDVLTAAVREGKLEASQLAGSMGSVIPIASNMGVEFHEVAAAMAAMSRTGTNAAEGATQVNAILVSLKKPADTAVSLFSKMGLSIEDVQDSLRNDGLIETLKILTDGVKRTGGDITEIFPNIRALKGVLDLTGAGVEANTEIFKKLQDTLGATDEAFEKTASSNAFKVTKALNAMKTSALGLGNAILVKLAPIIEKIGKKFREWSDAFDKLSPTMKNVVLGVLGFAAVLGPLLVTIGFAATTIIPGLVTAWGFLSGAILTATGAMISFTASMLANPFVAAAVIIAGVTVAFVEFLDTISGLNDSWQTFINFLNSGTDSSKFAMLQAQSYAKQLSNQSKKLEENKEKQRARYKTEKEAADAEKLAAEETRKATAAIEAKAAALKKLQEQQALANKRFATSNVQTTGANGSAVATGGMTLDEDLAAMGGRMKAPIGVIVDQMAEIGGNISGSLEGAAIGAAQGMADIIGALVGGEMGMADVGASLLSLVGDLAVQLGKATIAVGIGMIGLKAAFSNPLSAIAAGVAMVAIGSAMSSISSGLSSVGSGESGGGARSGGASSSRGSGGSSSGNFSGGGSSGGTYVFEIAGTKLVGVLKNTLDRNRALGGSLSIG